MGQKIKQFIQSLEQYIADLQKLVRANQDILAKLDIESLQQAVNNAFSDLFPSLPLTFWTVAPTGMSNGKVVVCKDAFNFEQAVPGGSFPTGMIQKVIRDPKDSSLKALIVLERTASGALSELSTAQKSLLDALSLAIIGALENIAALHEHKEKARMQAELETTRLVQRALLPQLAGSVHGLGVRTHFTPASECGGDWYGVYELAGDEIVIFMGDVTGHGMPSAMLTAVVKGFCDSMRTIDPDKLDLQVFFKELNKIVFEVGEHQRLMTFCGIRFNTKTGKGVFINAGHNAPFIIRNEIDDNGERKVSRIMALGNRLGYVRDNPVFAEKFFELREGDIVFLFTDGLVENKSPGGSQIGEKRVMTLFRSLKDADLNTIATEVHKLYEEHIKDRSPDDDVTYLAFEWKSDEINYRSYPPMDSQA